MTIRDILHDKGITADDLVKISTYKIRASGTTGVEMTLPSDRGLDPKSEIDIFAVAGLPDGVMLLVPKDAKES